ncbi:MAG: GNAT family N-acetyltransferase [Williamsia sp.]|nr:GNAT family N-acetyltransferase [Williamsia sp.]
MLVTDRLLITPLTYQQLATYLQGTDNWEEEIGLLKGPYVLDEGFRDMMENWALPSMKNTPVAHHLFYTCWAAADKERHMLVAELGFKGPPNARGEIEIGYGTQAHQRGKGYMTEAVGAMVAWAAAQPAVKAVLAETHNSNLASMRVVEKNGFEQFDRKRDMLWWKKELKQDAAKTARSNSAFNNQL